MARTSGQQEKEDSLHQWVLITADLHCLQSATLHLGSVNLMGPGYHVPAGLRG